MSSCSVCHFQPNRGASSPVFIVFKSSCGRLRPGTFVDHRLCTEVGWRHLESVLMLWSLLILIHPVVLLLCCCCSSCSCYCIHVLIPVLNVLHGLVPVFLLLFLSHVPVLHVLVSVLVFLFLILIFSGSCSYSSCSCSSRSCSSRSCSCCCCSQSSCCLLKVPLQWPA